MKILYFGTYERRYPRNAQVIACLRRAGVEVFERHVPVFERDDENWRAGAGGAFRVALAETRLLWPTRVPFDAVLVGYPGHFDVPRARRVAGRRPLVFNPLVSLWDTLVADRGRFRSGSFGARVLRAVDRRALRLPDLVVADTRANAAFLASLGGIPAQQVQVCFVGAEERLFHPGWQPRGDFTFLFVGKLIPLQGIDTILEAARRAPELRVRLVGSGQLGALLETRPPNVEWVPWVEYEELAGEYQRAGCALGIFGTSEKTARVIPNKVFQALACGTPVITGDTPAARELLRDGENALLVRRGDPDALAAAMRTLAADPAAAARLGEAGLETYREHASEEVLGRRWRSLLEGVV